jgi:hypothetical protein
MEIFHRNRSGQIGSFGLLTVITADQCQQSGKKQNIKPIFHLELFFLFEFGFI